MTKSPPRLCVAFDTNVLYTDVAHHLLNKDAKDLIQQHSSHPDLRVEWYLSEVVTGEREYQMQKKAYEIHARIEQLEKLLGYQLTTREILSERIRGVIRAQTNKFNIDTLIVKEDDVDWADIIQRSIFRRAPFDETKIEKGFRDAIIGESFVQLVSRQPKTESVCRLAFVSQDELLRTHLKERLGRVRNVRILESLNELETLINTLVSNVPEEKISDWRQKAASYFFKLEDKSTWYYRKNIGQSIANRFASEMSAVPSQSVRRKNISPIIQQPVFVQKIGQRIHWMTEIRITSKLFSKEQYNPLVQGSLGILDDQPQSIGALSIPRDEEEVGSGVTIIEVNWSVSVSPKKETLSRPKIEEMKFIDTNWSRRRARSMAFGGLFGDSTFEYPE